MEKKSYHAPVLTVEELAGADIVMISVAANDGTNELPSVSWDEIV